MVHHTSYIEEEATMSEYPTDETLRLVGGCERFESSLRLIVSPASGSFEPATELMNRSEATPIQVGQVVGRVVGTGGCVDVTSPFTGSLDAVLAWPNERLVKHQHVLVLRSAS